MNEFDIRHTIRMTVFMTLVMPLVALKYAFAAEAPCGKQPQG